MVIDDGPQRYGCESPKVMSAKLKSWLNLTMAKGE
jgi:hypothetical protein